MAARSTRTSLTCLALSVLFAPAQATAEAPDDLAAPLPITSPYHKPLVFGADLDQPPERVGEWVVFTNFDGGKMNFCGWGNNSPHNNCSHIFQGQVLPFSGDAGRRAAVVQVIRNDLKQFNIHVTDIRPESGDYDMEMIGDWSPPPGGGFAGVAPSIDCFNGNGGEVSFTLDYTNSATGIAKAVLQEIAHTWGLEHVDSKADLLYPTTQSLPDPTFVDECFQIVKLDDNNKPVPDSAWCPQQHTQFCPSNRQNSYRELLQIFGPGSPDLTAPTVEITAPAEGAEVDPKFDLTFTASDNQTPQLLTISLEIDGPSAAKTDPATWPSPSDLTFPISGLKPGAYTVTVKVVDEDDNEALGVVNFTVKGEPAPSTTGEPDTTGDPTTGDPTSDTDPTGEPYPTTGGDGSQTGGVTGADTGPAPATTGSPLDNDDGCGCRSDAASRGAPALLLLLGLARRRRRARR
jgi:MYXO-CTERM domain-containing protein